MNNAPLWKKIIAFFIDLFGSFIVLGYLIALVTGGTTEGGFQLNGMPAFALFAAVILYFILMNKYAKGTLGKHLMGIKSSEIAATAPVATTVNSTGATPTQSVNATTTSNTAIADRSK
jgi:hypothetical protein